MLEKRLIPISLLATVSAIVWLSIIHYEDATALAKAGEEAESDVAAESSANVDPILPAAAPTGDEVLFTLESSDSLKAVISTAGAAFKSIWLLDEQYGRRTLEPDEGGIGVPEAKRAPGPLDLVTTWDPAYYPFQMRFSSLTLKGSDGTTTDLAAKLGWRPSVAFTPVGERANNKEPVRTLDLIFK